MTNIEPSYTAIMYTDGSCLPPRGAYGGGCHGYLYTEDDYKKNGDKPNHYTITNKGYLEAHELSDTGDTVVKPSLYYNAAYPYGTVGTNNKAELSAIIDTINILANEYNIANIQFFTDSTYTIGVYTSVQRDMTDREWLKTERPNLDLWTKLADTLVKHKHIKIKLHKVVAHGTAIGNNIADRLAYAAREMGGKGHTNPLIKFYQGKYWKDKPVPHPMLNFKQVYFNVGIIPNSDEYLYPIMDYPKEVEKGKKSSEPLFGVTICKEPEPFIERIIRTYLEYCSGSQYLTTIDLRVLNTQEHLKMVELLGEHAYDYYRSKLSLLGETDIAVPITPPGLAQNALAKTMDMYKLYKLYLGGGGTDKGLTTVIDVTDQLYDINAKNKLVFKYDQTIVGPVVDVELDNTSITIPLVYGKDILTVNQLKRLGTYNVKVSIMLHRLSKEVCEYYVLLETPEVSGIYGNYYVNKLYR